MFVVQVQYLVQRNSGGHLERYHVDPVLPPTVPVKVDMSVVDHEVAGQVDPMSGELVEEAGIVQDTDLPVGEHLHDICQVFWQAGGRVADRTHVDEWKDKSLCVPK